jgi:iron complex outermembrane receptor protein
VFYKKDILGGIELRDLKKVLICSAITLAAPGAALAEDAAATPQAAAAQPATAPASTVVGEVIVTAQKRAQSVNSVGMTVATATGDVLQTRGVADVTDLAKVVTGFRAAPSNNLTPVYTLRGVGLYDSGLASSPTVSVYVDEVPLAFPIMTRAAGLDLERVEVLNGPQGTLFGQNSTGGAINYIAAKPTKAFEAGVTATYSRFDKIDTTGYVSGSLTDDLTARLAVRAVDGGAWQYSLTRPGDKLGASRELQGRLLLDYRPTDRLKLSLSLTASSDNSDTMAGQLTHVAPVVPALAAPGLVGSPLAPNDPRAADWTPGFKDRSNDRFYQAALRGEYAFGNDMTLISVTSFAHQKVDKMLDQDGSAAFSAQVHPFGDIDAFTQEVRLTGTTSKLTWIVGASYDHDRISDTFDYILTNNSTNQPIPTLPRFSEVFAATHQTVDTYAVFANAEYKINDQLSAHAGLRYTNDKRDAVNCTSDPTSNQALTNQFNALQSLFLAIGLKNTPVVPSKPFSCLQFTPAPDLTPSGPVITDLHQDNVSWRVGLDYKLDQGTLIYVSQSRGYKSGVISPAAALSVTSNAPVQQERVDAYEAGFKAPLFDHRLQFNAAAFYYDYQNKQIRTRFFDPVFALLEKLANIPGSRIAGVEAELVARPIEGLDLSVSGTYLDAKVTKPFISFNAQGAFGDFDGSRLPYTPRGSAVADAQYQWNISDSRKALVGASLTYNSEAQTTFATPALPETSYNMPAYTLLDLRAGISAADDSWRLLFWGRNVTNKFYITNIADANDSRYRYVGMPATYGVTLTYRMR